MQAQSTYIAFSLLLTCCLALSLASCQNSSWHLAASKKGGTVELCLSNGDECPQAGGVSPSSISVYRWDNMHDNDLVWDAEPKNPITASDISGVFTYGVAPKDWINKLTPPALICGKAYLVNPGAHYFALKCDGTVVVPKGPETRRTRAAYRAMMILSLKNPLLKLARPRRDGVPICETNTNGSYGRSCSASELPSSRVPHNRLVPCIRYGLYRSCEQFRTDYAAIRMIVGGASDSDLGTSV